MHIQAAVGGVRAVHKGFDLLLLSDVHDKGLEMPLVQPQAGGERVQFCLAGRADGQLAALGDSICLRSSSV